MAALQVLNGTLVAGPTAATLLSAFQGSAIGASFGPAGFLISYLAGVAYMLQELGAITSTTPIAGASSGALIALFFCCGITEQGVMKIVHDISTYCRAHRNCQGQLDAILRKQIWQNIPSDAYKRCSGVAHLAISVGVFPPKPFFTSNVLVSTFASNAELVDAAAASCYIPLWSGPGFTTIWNGKPAYDGFFTTPQPRSSSGSVRHEITVSSKTPPWSATNFEDIIMLISAAANQQFGAMVPNIFPKGASGGTSGGTSSTSEAGTSIRSGTAAAPAATISERVNVTAFGVAAANGIDISPGVFNPTDMTANAWANMMLVPGDDATNLRLLQLGRSDARSWAHLTGIEKAATSGRASKVQQERGQLAGALG